MINLLLILLVVGAIFAVVLYVGGMFLQGYIYTVPSEGLRWQAPVAALVLATFLFLWCWMVSQGEGGPQDIAYDTLFRFNARVDLVTEPLPVLTSTKWDGSTTTYRRHRTGQNSYVYRETSSRLRPWNGQGVVAISFHHQGKLFVLEEIQAEKGSYRQFQDPAQGWSMTEYDDGPTGIPVVFRWSRLLFNLWLNLIHLALWFVCLWLLLRFQWSHAFGLALAIWLLMTLAILPPLLTHAAGMVGKS